MMKVDPYLHAVLLLHGAGKDVTKENIVAVIKASGATADEAKASVLADAVKDVNFEDLLKQATVAAAAPVAAPAAAAPAKEEKEEDEGKKEEEAAAGLANLFG
ncbi:50S ribosomal protein P1 [Candidatus Micrarchaeota archaeon]|nr:50S ribosomal protein P1 [Candidatus Micrarchaeota archaeon]